VPTVVLCGRVKMIITMQSSATFLHGQPKGRGVREKAEGNPIKEIQFKKKYK